MKNRNKLEIKFVVFEKLVRFFGFKSGKNLQNIRS